MLFFDVLFLNHQQKNHPVIAVADIHSFLQISAFPLCSISKTMGQGQLKTPPERPSNLQKVKRRMYLKSSLKGYSHLFVIRLFALYLIRSSNLFFPRGSFISAASAGVFPFNPECGFTKLCITLFIFKNALAPSSLLNPPRIILMRDFISPLYLSTALLLCSNPYLRQAIGTPNLSLVTLENRLLHAVL